jgi:predicted small lipoprotein YifL
MRILQWAALLAFAATLTACGMGGASEPPVTEVAPTQNTKLQFSVGIATIESNDGTAVSYGLNTVSTLRQTNGLSGTLFNQPQIIGPSSFSVTPPNTGVWQYAGADLGTNHITWATLNQSHWTGPPVGNAQGSTGVFGYGLCPCDSNAGPAGGETPFFQAFTLPIYGTNTAGFGSGEFFYGGPPAYPSIGVTLFNLGFIGYSLGFTDFNVKPALGAYHLYAAVPPAFTTPTNPTPEPNPNGTPTPGPGVLVATAQLASLKALPPFTTPAFTPDRHGGGTIAVTVPAGVHEALVIVGAEACAVASPTCNTTCLQAHDLNAWFTVVTTKTGAQQLKLPDTLGPPTTANAPTASICPGQAYEVYAVATDYPAYESSYPQNLSIRPRITGPNGQADITTSGLLTGSYPT